MITLVILIVIFAFIIYNFYIDYRNWSNVGGSFAEGLTNLLPLKNLGGNPTQKLKECEGDCDGDHNCMTGLKCYQRSPNDTSDAVPGCAVGGSGDSSGYDYCINPDKANSKWPVWPNQKNLVNLGVNGPGAGQKLKECEADCDKDADCDTGLICYQRNSSYNRVPGCNMGGSGDTSVYDYCYDPKKKEEPSQASAGSSSKTATVTVSGRYGNKTLNNIQCEPGQHIGTESSAHATSNDCDATDQCLFELDANCQVKTLMQDRCKSQEKPVFLECVRF